MPTTPSIPYYPMTHDDAVAMNTRLAEIRNVLTPGSRQGVMYGFHIDGSESDPADKVSYVADAVGFVPAKMDYSAGKFSYGSWGDAWFMPRPVMLKPDGTVECYLDVNDYSKRADGTDSHIAHLGDVEASTTAAKAHAEDSYFVIGETLYQATAAIAIGDTIAEGTNCTAVQGVNAKSNAMMEWGRDGKKIWYLIVPDTGDDTSATVYIADWQADERFHAWSFINNDGDYAEHFYMPCYFGTIVNDGTNNVLRSLSGQSGANRCKNKTASEERTLVQANNPNGKNYWDTEVYCDIVLINLLLILIGKSCDTQAVFGEGLHTNGTDDINDAFTSGQHDAKGLFHGTNSGTANIYANAVKVFGMENWWGYMWRRFAGLVILEKVAKYKMTRTKADGSTENNYIVSTTADDYSGYMTGGTVPTASGSYINTMTFDENQFVPKDASGNSTHDYCDGLWTNTGVRYASRGGASAGTGRVGTFCLDLNSAASYAYWGIGAAPSCKPLS